MGERFASRMREVVERFATLVRSHHKVVIGLVVAGIAVLYLLVKTFGGSDRIIYKVDNLGTFTERRIFNQGVTSSGTSGADGRDRIFTKTLAEIGGDIKIIKDDLSSVKGRVERLESDPKTKGESKSDAAADASKPSETPGSAKADGQGNSTANPGTGTPSAVNSSGSLGTGSYRIYPRRPVKGPAIISFPVKDSASPSMLGIVLPPGSYVRAKLMTGVEAPEGRPYPVLLQLDFAYILPNRHRLDLSGCFMIVKAQGDLSTERVQMQATKLSCVSRAGRMFERDINGFVADGADNSFAISGTVSSKQDRVAAMAFLSSVVEGVSKSIQDAQTTKQSNAFGGTNTSVTGDEGKYLLAGGASHAAGAVTQWYLKQAESLLPTIKVGSGADVWVVMQDSVSLPNSFFRKSTKGGNCDAQNSSFDFLSRVLD